MRRPKIKRTSFFPQFVLKTQTHTHAEIFINYLENSGNLHTDVKYD